MGTEYLVRKATHIGRSHLLSFVNRQDALALFDGNINNQRTIIGIVCDGCSEGTASEVGAHMASSFLVRETYHLLECGVTASVVPNILYSNLIGFLRQLVNAYQFTRSSDQVNFIKNTLLFTVVGFVLTDVDTVVFYAGDGTIVINEEVIHLDSDNRPNYPAYQLVDRSALENSATSLPDGFDILTYYTSDLNRLAIGSDAWKDEQDALDQVWGFKNSGALQRTINRWSKNEHRFRDDVSIITVEIVEIPEGDTDYAGDD